MRKKVWYNVDINKKRRIIIMARGKKESASLNLKIDKKIYEALDDNSGQTKTFIVEKALKEYKYYKSTIRNEMELK